MTTSLAQQLARLAVPHTQALLGEDKRKASLLFEPKEAANIDKETFYALGLNGLQELENIDREFEEFNDVLFSDASQNFERSVQTKEVNKKLDESISKFLIKLSPYFLLRPAHKALEWLIYRYHIHWYNVDELMQCILPYHEANIFVRAVQLIKLEDPANKWHWLHHIQKPGSHLPRMTVINHCRADLGFLTFVCEMVPNFLKIHGNASNNSTSLRVIMSFYATTVVGALENGNVKEEMIAKLLPYLTQGFKSKNIEYKASSYMIMSQLVTKAKIKKEFFANTLPALSKHIPSVMISEALTCICLIYETQTIDEVPKRTFRHICRLPAVVSTIQMLSSKYIISKFLDRFLSRLTREGIKDAATMTCSEGGDDMEQEFSPYSALLEGILSDVQLTSDTAQHVIKILLDEFMSQKNDEPADIDSLNRIKQFIGIMEKRYPLDVDAVIEKTTKRGLSPNQQSIVQEFITATMSAAKHSVIPDSETNLVLAANHPKAEIRKLAIQQLIKIVNNNEAKDKDFVASIFIDRLNDDDAEVVKAVLQDVQVLKQVIEDQKLYSLISKLLLKSFNFHSDKKKLIVPSCLTLLTEDHFTDVSMDTVLVLLLPFLIKTQNQNKRFAAMIMGSKFAEKHPLLKNLHEETSEKKKQKSHLILQNLVNALKEQDIASRKSFLIKLLDADKEHLPVLYDVISLFVLTGLLPSVENATEGFYYETHIVAILEKCLLPNMIKGLNDGVAHDDIESILLKAVRLSVTDSTMLLPFVLWILDQLITSICVSPELKDIDWWEKEEQDCPLKPFKFYTDLFTLLTNAASNKETSEFELFRNPLLKFLQRFPDIMLYQFLEMMWRDSSDVITQLNALYIAEVFIENSSIDHLNQQDSVIPSLLCCLSSDEKKVRKAAVACFKSIQEALEDKNDVDTFVYIYLIREVVQRQEELISDCNHISEAIGLILRDGYNSSEKNLLANLESLVSIVLQDETPLSVKDVILMQLSGIDEQKLLTKLLPFLTHLIEKESLNESETRCIHRLVQRFNEVTASLLSQKKVFDVFVACMNKTTGHDAEYSSVQYIALSQIKKEFFTALTPKVQQELISELFDLWVDSKLTQTASCVTKCLKGLTLDAQHVIVELNKLRAGNKATTVRDAKRVRRQSKPAESEQSELDTRPWQRSLLVLEMLQSKKKIHNVSKLIQSLFNILKIILELDSQVPAEYAKQLVMSCLNNICTKLTPEDVENEEHFNVELIVQCIRTSNNPQTHHHALLLLTVAAALFPSLVLHNIMSIFTFMGANLLRQDDSYSFQVITKTVETVIPALIEASEKSASETTKLDSSVVYGVIQVFVDAYPHVPEHRRLPIFLQLVNTLGPKKYLWPLLMLLLDGHVLHESTKTEDSDSKSVHTDIEFCANICSQFDPAVQVHSGQQLLQYLRKLPAEKEDKTKVSRPTRRKSKVIDKTLVLIKLENHTAKQYRHFRYITTSFIGQILVNEQFLEKVEQSKGGNEEMVDLYQCMLEEDLQYISQIARCLTDSSDHLPTNKFWKVMLTKAYDILDKVNNLLPNSVFVEVISGLMKHDLQLIRRKAMELMNSKLQSNREPFSEKEASLFLSVIDQLVEVVKTASDQSTEESSYNQLTALFCLRVQCKIFGNKNPDKFKPILQVVTNIFSRENISSQVASGALLCLAELCSTLKAHSIPYLSKFMPKVIQVLQNDKKLQSNDMLLVSAVTTVQKVVECLPHFISPYVQDIIGKVAVLSILPETETEATVQKSQFYSRLKSVRQNLAALLPTRVLLPAVSKCYEVTEDENRESLCTLFEILSDHLLKLTKEQLTGHQTQILNFFLVALDYRNDHSELNVEEVEKIECYIIDAIVAMVMKLSESSFRPMFFKLFDWATRSDTHKDRMLTFYKLCDGFAMKLKSLFTLFAGHFIKNAANLLNENNQSKSDETTFGCGETDVTKSSLLLSYILDCLQKCFLYDNEGLINKERFDTLMQPLVDQIENTQGGEDVYVDRIAQHVVPCISQFALAVGDDASWKPLNYQILLKTRNESPKVRFAALKVVEAVCKILGENYMALLPESIPFLAELMEDESFEVEQLCQDVVGQLEVILGEPLQKYF
ncbi:HEAT repeat-containing protein 1-like [Tubulanus polymorphus]|uniref:HEAT repeat-containing protein 1-like n=1 Tax=Tubulanus polymorphus TaxID=672921 RepID=UPI003DA2C979